MQFVTESQHALCPLKGARVPQKLGSETRHDDVGDFVVVTLVALMRILVAVAIEVFGDEAETGLELVLTTVLLAVAVWLRMELKLKRFELGIGE